MEDAIVYEAFSSDDITNLVEHRARCTPEASPLYLARRQDLRELALHPPALSLSQATLAPQSPDTPETP
jgi:hypothetical protein